MEWSAVALEGLVGAFAFRRGAAEDVEEGEHAHGAILFDLSARRRLALERRDLEPYLALVSVRAPAAMRSPRAAPGRAKVVPFRR